MNKDSWLFLRLWFRSPLKIAGSDAERLKNATYLEVKEEAKYGHGARGRTVTVWGPKLREWLRKVRPE